MSITWQYRLFAYEIDALRDTSLVTWSWHNQLIKHHRKVAFKKRKWFLKARFQFSWNVIVYVVHDEWTFERTRLIDAHWTYDIFNSFSSWICLIQSFANLYRIYNRISQAFDVLQRWTICALFDLSILSFQYSDASSNRRLCEIIHQIEFEQNNNDWKASNFDQRFK